MPIVLWITTRDVGCVSGFAANIRCRGRGPHASLTSTCTGSWAWSNSNRERPASRGRTREFLVREPSARKSHARFDERGVETEHGLAIEAPAIERAGQQIGRAYATAPHLDSTQMGVFEGVGGVCERIALR